MNILLPISIALFIFFEGRKLISYEDISRRQKEKENDGLIVRKENQQGSICLSIFSHESAKCGMFHEISVTSTDCMVLRSNLRKFTSKKQLNL